MEQRLLFFGAVRRFIAEIGSDHKGKKTACTNKSRKDRICPDGKRNCAEYGYNNDNATDILTTLECFCRFRHHHGFQLVLCILLFFGHSKNPVCHAGQYFLVLLQHYRRRKRPAITGGNNGFDFRVLLNDAFLRPLSQTAGRHYQAVAFRIAFLKSWPILFASRLNAFLSAAIPPWEILITGRNPMDNP